MKFDYKSYSNHLESENERLNAIIDEIEEINEDHLTEIFMLNLKIKKAIDYINEELDKNRNKFSVVNDYNIFLDGMERAYMNCLEILGADDNEET